MHGVSVGYEVGRFLSKPSRGGVQYLRRVAERYVGVVASAAFSNSSLIRNWNKMREIFEKSSVVHRKAVLVYP